MFYLIGGIFLGWSLGANDASNIFGTAVTSRMVRFSIAAILTSIFVIVGALLEGQAGMETYNSLTSQDITSAFATTIASAFTVTFMTALRLPVSTSQAVVGAIIGVGLVKSNVNWAGLQKVVLCWIGTPIGAMILAFILYKFISPIYNRIARHIFLRDRVLKISLVIVGSYGAYALGANNVANVTGPFVRLDFGSIGLFTPFAACLVGSIAIAIGVVTYSKSVMYTVGKSITKLNGYTAFIAVFAEAITVWLYTQVGVPVSTSQAVVGAIFGIGLVKGMQTVKFKTVRNIVIGWITTPIISGSIAYIFYVIIYNFID